MNQRVLSINSKEEWRDALNQLGDFDFFHTYDFHHLGELNGEGAPILFVLVDDRGKSLACWPALRRPIDGTDYFDLTSVYGYGGPLFAQGVDVEWALASIFEAMCNKGLISLFSRMHPLYIERIPDNDMRGKKLGDVVLIDVQAPLSGLAGYRGSHRREISNAKRRGVQAVVDYDCSKLPEFSKIYLDAMRDLKASNYYHFDLKYFEYLKQSNDFKPVLIYAELDGVMIAASLFILTNTVMQYFLSGTMAAYRKLAPSKLVIAKAHELSISLGVEKIILGGGVGSTRDALFDFKAGFSDLTKPFYLMQKIFDENIYSSLCKRGGIDPDATSFFPAYRA